MDNRREEIARRRRVQGLSQEALAALLNVARTTVARWESGEVVPLPWVRPRLAEALGLSLVDLDAVFDPAALQEVVVATPVAEEPPGPATLDDDVLWRILMDEGDELERKQFLRLVLATGAVSALSTVEAAASPRSVLDPRSVKSYASIAAVQRDLYWSLDAPAMLDVTLGHLRLGTQLLNASARDDHLTRTMSAAVAHTALLAARVSLFDLGQPRLAERCFAVAESIAADARDPWLAAVVAGHHAFVPGFAGDLTAAQRHLDLSMVHLRYRPSGLVESWLGCVSAELHARNGSAVEARNLTGRAEQALARSTEAPGWFDFYDASRLAGFAGNAELLAGKPATAATWLGRALDELDDKATKQRTVLLLDLAAAHRTLDADQGAAYADEALTLLETEPYSAAIDRLGDVMSRFDGTPHGTRLAERARTLQPA
ncbi:helix-turn-helix domain-containing protein [Promicromonospora alba]|uniref:Helix-turn-helix domain-containing protein n=1 Tax=Promicromonospora alba TaxID=1616110 RepID=A0ABV9HEX1_9MICO